MADPAGSAVVRPDILTRMEAKSPVELCDAIFRPTVFSRKDLGDAGFSSRAINAAVQAGALTRLRRDRYVRPGVDDDIAEAVRIGGRVTCLSLLQMIGVFVLQVSSLHVHVPHNMSRLRRKDTSASVLHWNLLSGRSTLHHVVSLRDAIRHAVRCQKPRDSIATLDSLLHHGLLTRAQLEDVFRELPGRFQALLNLVDESAESGPETFVRLMLRTIGASFETQVEVPGVGRVDFVVDGWLIIECDSKAHHEGWEKQQQDRRRDLEAARLGYVTIRPLASDVLYQGESVQKALVEILATFGARFRSGARA